MHDVAWRGMWIFVRSKDAQKQLARTSLTGCSPEVTCILAVGTSFSGRRRGEKIAVVKRLK